MTQVVVLLIAAFASTLPETKPLTQIRAVRMDSVVVTDSTRVKDEKTAVDLVTESLRRALRMADIEITDNAPVRAHIVLDEFTGGSQAKRTLIGFGAGRSTIDCRLVVADTAGKVLAERRIRVRGNVTWSPYQGDKTQGRQAMEKLDRQMFEEIQKLK
jgi:hypothetical protein